MVYLMMFYKVYVMKNVYYVLDIPSSTHTRTHTHTHTHIYMYKIIILICI